MVLAKSFRIRYALRSNIRGYYEVWSGRCSSTFRSNSCRSLRPAWSWRQKVSEMLVTKNIPDYTVSWRRKPHASPLWNPEISNTNSLLKWFTCLLHDFTPIVWQRSLPIPYPPVRPDELIRERGKSVFCQTTRNHKPEGRNHQSVFLYSVPLWFDSLSQQSNILRRNIPCYDPAKYSILCSSIVEETNIYFPFPPGRELSTFYPAYADLEILYLGTIPDSSCYSQGHRDRRPGRGDSLPSLVFLCSSLQCVCACVCMFALSQTVWAWPE